MNPLKIRLFNIAMREAEQAAVMPNNELKKPPNAESRCLVQDRRPDQRQNRRLSRWYSVIYTTLRRTHSS